MPMQLGANPKSKGKGKDSKGKGKGEDVKDECKGKDAKSELFKNAKSDDQKICFYCNKSEVAASPHHPNDTAVVVPLQCLLPGERHTSTFIIVMPCVNSERSCESPSEQAVRSPGPGSIVPAETTHVRPIAAILSNETHLMMDTCAGASIFPRGFDQSVTDDSTVAPVQLSTATDDPVHDGRKFHVRDIEADVSFPVVSIGEASQQGNWFVFGPGCQAMLQVMCEGPKCGKVGETPRSV